MKLLALLVDLVQFGGFVRLAYMEAGLVRNEFAALRGLLTGLFLLADEERLGGFEVLVFELLDLGFDVRQ